MEDCSLPQIPARLHANGRPELPLFEIGEQLYRRCKPVEVENPFASLSLVDLSVNRTGPADIAPLCEEVDVLRNFSSENEEEWIQNEVAVSMVIKELNEVGTYSYVTTLPDGGVPVTDTCVLTLAHDQIPCNYAHSAFQLRLNGKEVTFGNYKDSLGDKKYRKFRDKCRFELGKMIIKGEIWLPPAA